MQPQQVQEVFKRKQFTLSAVCLGESIVWYCLFTYYLRQRGKTGKERLDLMLYQACIGKTQTFILMGLRYFNSGLVKPPPTSLWTSLEIY